MTGHSLEELSCRLTLDQFTRDSDHGAAAVSDAGAVAQPAGGRQGRPGTRGGEARHGGRGVQRQTKTQSGEQNEYSLISCYTTKINLIETKNCSLPMECKSSTNKRLTLKTKETVISENGTLCTCG